MVVFAMYNPLHEGEEGSYGETVAREKVVALPRNSRRMEEFSISVARVGPVTKWRWN